MGLFDDVFRTMARKPEDLTNPHPLGSVAWWRWRAILNQKVNFAVFCCERHARRQAERGHERLMERVMAGESPFAKVEYEDDVSMCTEHLQEADFFEWFSLDQETFLIKPHGLSYNDIPGMDLAKSGVIRQIE